MADVTLLGETLPLRQPASPSLALELIRLYGAGHREWAGGAALAACIPAMARRAGATFKLTELPECGQTLYDWLIVSRKVPVDELNTACMVALDHVLEILPSPEDNEEAEGNSEPTP